MADYLVRAEKLSKLYSVGGRMFSRKHGYLHAVENVSLGIKPGEVFGLIGETGCGKTTFGRMLVKLIEPSSGSLFFENEDITRIKGGKLRGFRRKAHLIFQDPYVSFDPRFTVEKSLHEASSLHFKNESREKTSRRLFEVLEAVGLVPQENFLGKSVDELSGGQNQRVSIARALIVNPKFVVADEPVSMLDVSIRASILNLMLDVKDRYGLTYMFILHDLPLAQQICQRIAVMYSGQIVELGSADELILNPVHPYTKALISAIPNPRHKNRARKERVVLSSEMTTPIDPPPGCRLYKRCPFASDTCKNTEKQLVEVSKDHYVACVLSST
jgi:oligopeptide/dipeptide ABC transporter ATP-binding protein